MFRLILIFLFLPFSLLAQKAFQINFSDFKNKILQTPAEVKGVFQNNINSHISLNINGNERVLNLNAYSVLPKGFNSSTKTYYGTLDNENIRLTLNKDHFEATIIKSNEVEVINPVNLTDSLDFYENTILNPEQYECLLKEKASKSGAKINVPKATSNYNNGGTLRTYRMALMITQEFRPGTDSAANAQIILLVNNLNGIFEKEIAVRFALVAYGSNLFYRNPAATTTYNQDLNYVRTQMNTIFGSTNYDIGHCVHGSGGGVAYLGVVCNQSYKGGGWSGNNNSNSVLLMAHELGHMLDADHTFLGNGNANCGDGNRSLSTALEPGSGTTIMSYNGLCASSQNINVTKVPYFHSKSLESMITYITASWGGSCSVNTPTSNTAPVATVSTNFNIPKGTPFVLSATATDAQNDPINYTWDQFDFPVANDVGALGNTTFGVGAYAAAFSTTAPLFKSSSSSINSRTFPVLSAILNNANDPIDVSAEDLPQVARTLNFRLTVRDNKLNGGGVSAVNTAINVIGTAGPFKISSQNSPVYWQVGQTVSVNWLVNNTNLSPISCSNINILLSTDGGNTFPITLANNTPNDGTQTITVPNNINSNGRIKIVSSNTSHIFFDINDAVINIVSALPVCAAENIKIRNLGVSSAQQGSPSLNLETVSYDSISTFTRTTNANDPVTFISQNQTGVCVPSVNGTIRYKSINFLANGNVPHVFTITSFSGSRNVNLVQGEYLGPCNNWLNSSVLLTGTTLSYATNITNTLEKNTKYTLNLSSSSSATSYGTVNVSVSPAILEILPRATSFYTVKYLIVKNGTIVDIQDKVNMSNASKFTNGQYTVYGISMLTDNASHISYINQAYSNLQASISNGSFCGKVSSNNFSVSIGCEPYITLSGTATSNSSQAINEINSVQLINTGINSTNKAGRAILLNPGFEAKSGSVFLAEIKSCN